MGLQTKYTDKEIKQMMKDCPFREGDRVSVKDTENELSNFIGFVQAIVPSVVTKGELIVHVEFGVNKHLFKADQLELVRKFTTAERIARDYPNVTSLQITRFVGMAMTLGLAAEEIDAALNMKYPPLEPEQGGSE